MREITITKTISGNQSDYDDGFTFTVTVNGDANEMFKGVITRHGNSKESAGEDPDVLTFVSDASLSNITLYGGDVLTIYGLSSNDTYTVIEDRTTSVNQGYNDTTVKVGSGDATSGYEATDVQYDTNVVFNNDKTVSTPTGIAMTFAPYALMVVAAGGFAALFLRKKREDF